MMTFYQFNVSRNIGPSLSSASLRTVNDTPSISNLRNSVNSLRSSTDDLRTELSTLITHLNSNINDATSILMVAYNSLFDATSDILLIQSEINSLTGDISSVLPVTASVVALIPPLSIDVSSLTGDISTIQTDIISINSDISVLLGDISSINTDITLLETGVVSLTSDILTVYTNISSLTADISSLSVVVATLTGDISAVMSSLSTATSDILSLDINGTVISGEILSIQTDLDLATTDIVALQTDIFDATSDIVTIQSDMDGITSDIITIQENIVSLNLDITDIENAINTAIDDINAIPSYLNSLTSDIQSISIDALTGDIQVLQADITALTSDILTLSIGTNTLTGDIISVQNDIISLTQDVSELTSVLSSATTDLQLYSEYIDPSLAVSTDEVYVPRHCIKVYGSAFVDPGPSNSFVQTPLTGVLYSRDMTFANDEITVARSGYYDIVGVMYASSSLATFAHYLGAAIYVNNAFKSMERIYHTASSTALERIMTSYVGYLSEGDTIQLYRLARSAPPFTWGVADKYYTNTLAASLITCSPDAVFIRYKLSTPQSRSGSSEVDLVLDQPVYDSMGEGASLSSTGAIIVPKDGVYRVGYTVAYDSAAAANINNHYVYIEVSAVSRDILMHRYRLGSTGTSQTLRFYDHVELKQGWTLQLITRGNPGNITDANMYILEINNDSYLADCTVRTGSNIDHTTNVLTTLPMSTTVTTNGEMTISSNKLVADRPGVYLTYASIFMSNTFVDGGFDKVGISLLKNSSEEISYFYNILGGDNSYHRQVTSIDYMVSGDEVEVAGFTSDASGANNASGTLGLIRLAAL